MAKHFIGTKVNGVRSRFNRELNDQEFEEMLNQIGGVLPKGFWVWHFEESIPYKDNKKAQAVAKLPVVCTMIGAYVDPMEAVIKARELERESDYFLGT